MSYVQKLQKFKKDFGGRSTIFDWKKNMLAFYDFVDTIEKFNVEDLSAENDNWGIDDVDDDEFAEDVAEETLRDIVRIGEYAAKLLK